MTETKVKITPKGKVSGAWIIQGNPPPPATNGIEVFSLKKDTKVKKASHA